MKIAYICPSFYLSAGIERVLTVKANYLADVFGYQVYIIAGYMAGKKAFFRLSKNVELLDLNVFQKNSQSGNILCEILYHSVDRYKYKRAFCLKVEAVLNRIKPDICISTSRIDFSFLYKLHSDGSVKLFELHVEHESRIQPWNSNYLLSRVLGYYQLYRDESRITKYTRSIVLTNDELVLWRRRQNIEVITNPITIVPPSEATLMEKRVIAIGRLRPEKGFDILLRAWNIVNQELPDWRLEIYGTPVEAKYEQEIFSLLTELRLKNVQILPPSRQIEHELVNSSLLVLPSRAEAFGLVISEAMACGVPCVACDCNYGPRNIIDNGRNGFLVPVNGVKEMADAMIKIMANDHLRKAMGKNALEKSKEFNIDHIMQKWKDLFEEVTKNKNKGSVSC